MQEGNALKFRIEGPEASALAAEIREILESELATSVTERAEVPDPRGQITRSVDPLALSALVLAVPGAILAAADLAQRLELKPRVDRLLQRLRTRTAARPGNRVEILDSEGRGRVVDGLGSDELLEISIQLSIQVRRQEEG